jgi:ribonuclease R
LSTEKPVKQAAGASRPARKKSSTTPKTRTQNESNPQHNIDVGVPSRERILDALRSSGRGIEVGKLADSLGTTVTTEGFERRLAAMERDGQLLPVSKGVIQLARHPDFIAGRVVGHRDGYGFMIRDDGERPDIWLAPKEMLKVLHGDRVLVKLSGSDYRGKPEGMIVEVTERRTKRLVGRLLNERGVFVVVPEDQRIKHDILIPGGELKKAQPGQVVTVEIVEQPSRYTQPIGRIVEVLGEIGDPGMEIEIAVRKFDVPHVFSEDARLESERLPDSVQKKDMAHRLDLRDVPFVTIDGEDARDFDDAVYAEPIEGRRGWRLLVAIADVSHYVTADSALDRDAYERSTSVYFPRRVIPMLPERLSNGLCSLNPAVDRLVLVCDMVVETDGTVSAYQFFNGVIHSAARLTYTEVFGILSAPEGPTAETRRAVVPQLQFLNQVFHALLEARERRGAIDFDTTETYIVCDPQGKIEQILPRTRNDAHKLIEECMLAANVCAADFMTRSKHLGLYRVHDGPTPDKLANLRAFLKTLGLMLAGGDDPQASDYATLSQRIRTRPDAPLLQTMLLRSMQQAIYSPDNGGHFGLAYPAYAHFTSPIRRYPDLLTHRVIKALLEGKKYVPQIPGEGQIPQPRTRAGANAKEEQQRVHHVWEQLGLHCSANERRADDASRDVQAWLKCYFMREKVGEQFKGAITGVTPFGLFVTLDDLYVEGLVHISELGTDFFQFNEAMNELRGERTGQRFRLTDPLTVQVSRVDLEARKIEFRLVRGATFSDLMRGVLPDEVAQKRNGAAKTTGKRAAKPRETKRSAEPNHVKSAGRAKKTPAKTAAKSARRKR